MNGRIYDPTLGRFLQADPFIQAPTNSQSYNRYSYVLNNPLSYTDPSGYFSSKLWKNIKPFVGAIAAVIVSIYCQVCGASMWNAAMTGAAIGAGSAAINGGNIFKGALIGAFSGAAFYQIGATFTGNLEGGFGHMLAHGVTGGITSVLQGGKFGHGFFSAGLSKALNVSNLIGTAARDSGLRVITSAIIGGTISKITGGKFSNGAITAAFAQAFNGEKQLHRKRMATISRDIYDFNDSHVGEYEIDGYELQDVYEDDTGLKAALLSDGDSSIVAFAGTDPKSGSDWAANGAQYFGLSSDQYNSALAYGASVSGTVRYTGHSLGGGIASMAALAHARSATVFNAAGLDSFTRIAHMNSRGSVHHYHSATDYLQITNIGLWASVPGSRSVIWSLSGHSMVGLCDSIGCRAGL